MDSDKIISSNIYISSTGPKTMVFELEDSLFDMRTQEGQLTILQLAITSLKTMHQTGKGFHSAYFSLGCAESFVGNMGIDTQLFLIRDKEIYSNISNIQDGRESQEVIIPEFSLDEIGKFCRQSIQACKLNCGEDEFHGWHSLLFNSYSFSIPTTQDVLAIDYGPGSTTYFAKVSRVSNMNRVGGPDEMDTPAPLTVEIVNYGYKVAIVAHFIWSYFFDPVHAGAQWVMEWERDLQTLGWVRKV